VFPLRPTSRFVLLAVLLFLVSVLVVLSSCGESTTTTSAPAAPAGGTATTAQAATTTGTTSVHVAGADCAKCHSAEQAAWASSQDKHAASPADVLLNTEHNQAEGLPPANGNPANDCLLCHSAFQAKAMTVGDFVQPLNAGTNNKGPSLPEGSWKLTAAVSQWQATKCEVCHDPTSTSPKKLAKYDGNTATYQDVSAGKPVSHVFSLEKLTYTDVPVSAGLAATATTLCDSCHDPADQGGDEPPAGMAAYGKQGGDSRAYVTEGHDFQPVDPTTTATCKVAGCHALDRSSQGPGVVHVNHLK
jgi:hypothetical protein